MHGVVTLSITEGDEMGENMTNDEDCMVVAEEAIPEWMERMESTEDLDDRTKMDICLQEVSLIILISCTIFMPQVTGDLVEYGEVESGSTLYYAGVYVQRIPC